MSDIPVKIVDESEGAVEAAMRDFNRVRTAISLIFSPGGS